MKTFRRLLRYAAPLHHYIPEYVIYTVIGIVFGMVNFAMLIPLLNVIFNQVEDVPKMLVHPTFSFTITYFVDLFNYYFYHFIQTTGTKQSALYFVCAVIGVCITIANLGRYMSTRVIVRLKMTMLSRLRTSLYEKFTQQSLSFYSQRQKGDLLSTMTNDVQEIEGSVVNSMQILLRDPFIIIGYFAALFYLSVKLTLFTIVFFPVSGIIISYISKKLKQKGWYSQELLGKILNVTEETLGGIRIIQSFTAEKFMQKKFGEVNHRFVTVSKSMFNQRELASPTSEILGVIVVVVLVIYGGTLVLNGSDLLTGATFMTYLVFYSQIMQPAKNISTAITTMQRGIVASERIFTILDTQETIPEKPGAQALEAFNTSIQYENVSFKYEQQYVLKHIDLTIGKGRMVALVGRSGAGKSTIADLLPRFYDVNEGHIRIDGTDIRDIKTTHLRNLIGIVSQEAILFNDTVFNNIAFGHPEADREAVIQAARIANAHEFITQLENGYDTPIGDRGMKLSGGQRQRLTIARAIFKNPPILILDEATSALDTESEKLVQGALDKLMQNRTTIVIAHRLSTIQHASEIIVMDQGEIKERGTHELLLAQKGIYHKLVEMQEFK
ncbi:ABC transporter ATP-binding protein [Chitinophaga nivalis]|uniref:ABC transporter transmembrane domain-containing protein n=1 Tax=Chitinophaga nivalis TaxID=2991709 RepID=A0ABT3IU91_9BACT|nr:ABC transporter transmembrane domain-containing protein [Chitinophaga nivalis]MCW3462780.1 ABC transporter transmembrane domain-containing protein [Chitinophaga nivalis]MCW3487530.1 ABC transporter transmembrane domain-containing protein [Chitinophaga nivalis]